MATAKKATKKAQPKAAKKPPFVLDDAVLWAVVKKSWIGGGVVQAVYPSRTLAEEARDQLNERYSGLVSSYVVQRAPLVLDDFDILIKSNKESNEGLNKL